MVRQTLFRTIVTGVESPAVGFSVWERLGSSLKTTWAFLAKGQGRGSEDGNICRGNMGKSGSG